MKCPDCDATLIEQRQTGPHGRGVRYHCPNGDCPVIYVERRYRHGRYPKVIKERVVRATVL